MRISALLLLIGILSVSATSYSQEAKVSISVSNKTVKDVFAEIKAQTNYSFWYDLRDVDVNRKVNVNVENETVRDVLTNVLKGQDLAFELKGNHIVIMKRDANTQKKLEAFQQIRPISGTIKDEKGEAIIGANIIVKGTGIGTTSDFDGKFTLETPANTILQITYIGYLSQEVNIGNKNSLEIIMVEDTESLDEVVVVGYGTQKKITVTGSIANVGGETLTSSPTQSVSNALSGRLTGVIATNRSGEPGNDFAGILIRGKSTLGNTSPLIVIDGVWGRDGFNQVDPNDVESVTVLKDASAAIYGAQAANGVILITTKRGKTEKPTITYSMNVALTQPTRLPKMANAAEYARVYNDLLNIQGQPDRFSEAEIVKFGDGTDPINYPDTDWVEETMKNVSAQHQHNLSLRGGTERVKYYISGNYSNQNSIFKNGINDYTKFGVRSNLDASVTENIKVSLDLSLIQTDRTSPRMGSNIVRSMIRNYPYIVARYPNGLPGTGIERGENPVVTATDEPGYREAKVNLYQTTFNFDIKIPWIKGLGIDGFAAYDLNHTSNKNWDKPWTVYSYNATTDTYDPRVGGSVTKPQLTETYAYNNRLTLNAKLKYDRTFEDHRINSFIAIEQTLHKSNNFSAFRKNYLTDVIDQLYAGDERDQVANGSASETARRNLFGRVSYGFKDKYLLDFNFRYDGSSKFPKDSRWGFFPGISAGWRLSEEQFIKDNLQIVDNLKLRASWGQMGNDLVDAFQYLSSYSFTSGYYLGANSDPVKGLVQGLTPNPNITWEVANTYNAGIDMTLWNGLLGLTLELFKTRRNNILTARNASIPVYTGLKLPNENIGTVDNKGLEIELSHTNRKNEWTYSIAGNFSFSRNKIIDIDEAANAQIWQMRTGHPMGTDLYYVDSGIYRTQEEIDKTPHPIGTKIGDLRYKDVSGDGEIDSRDRVRLDKTNIPEVVFGLDLGAEYKGFDLSMLIQGQARAWQYIYLQSGLGGNTLRDLALNSYSDRNADLHSKYPRLTSYSTEISGYRSTFWLKNASYVRLKNMELGYTIPKELSSKLKIDKLRVYISGFNLITIDGLKWFDPEGSSEAGDFYPQNKIYNIGLNLTF